MAGHSHSANIARRKGAVDAKRGKLFSKMARAIIVAARQGGGDMSANLGLKYAVERAKAVSLPKDNIERAIKRGTGELTDGSQLESCMYEAIGPGGAMVLIEILTDNRNRTAPQIRKILELKNAHLGNCAWAFERKGVVIVPSDGVSEEQVLEAVLEAGAEDIQSTPGAFEVTTGTDDIEAVRAALEAAEIPVEEASIAYLPTTPLPVDADTGRKVLALLDDLDDHDDVQNVYSNVDFPDELLAEQ